MRASDALAAERRRQPMTEVSGDHVLRGPDGEVRFRDLFEGRRQLALLSFMFRPAASRAAGCSMLADQVGHLAHLHARDTTFAMVSRASVKEIEATGAAWAGSHPWSRLGDGQGLYDELGVGGGFAFNVFLRDGDRSCAPTAPRTAAWRRSAASGASWTAPRWAAEETWEDAPDWVPTGPTPTSGGTTTTPTAAREPRPHDPRPRGGVPVEELALVLASSGGVGAWAAVRALLGRGAPGTAVAGAGGRGGARLTMGGCASPPTLSREAGRRRRPRRRPGVAAVGEGRSASLAATINGDTWRSTVTRWRRAPARPQTRVRAAAGVEVGDTVEA